MNIVAILASGVGNRFESNIPKQFHKIHGKMIIEYVIEAIAYSNNVDKIVIATNLENNKSFFTGLSEKYNIELINGGATRNQSLKNVLDYIHINYSCKKIIVCDSVRPLITADLIDNYFELLNDFDVVVTAQHITDSLGCVDLKKVDRNRYYLMQSPEGFKFDLLYNNFSGESHLTEVSQQLPEDSKVKLYFSFSNNIKLTYPADLKYIESIINVRDNNIDSSQIIYSVNRLAEYLNINYPLETKEWIVGLKEEVPKLLKKWQITHYEVNKTSHFGLILFSNSIKYGKCVLKIIPPFIKRYCQEKLFYQCLPNSIMCEMYDFEDSCSAILMEELSNDNVPEFLENPKLFIDFFSRCFEQNISPESETVFSNYQLLLKEKVNQNNFSYKNQEIMEYIKKSNKLYNNVFENQKVVPIHGDLHRYNMLMKEDKLLAIDPIGYIAPKEFDIARFIGTELTDDIANAKQNYRKIVECFSKKFDREKLESALYIDIAFRLHNSIFENSNTELTDKWLYILKEVI